MVDREVIPQDPGSEAPTQIKFVDGKAASLSLVKSRLVVVDGPDRGKEMVVGKDLIEGGTGTGKEVVARAVHAYSQRKAKAFIVVDCGAIPRNLIESELFGHEKGSFTGATEQRKGAFELANQGTIFLDELGELPLDL